MTEERFDLEADREGRFRFRTDPAELQRRWRITREAMRREGYDCLLLWAGSRVFGGAQKYLTDLQYTVYPHVTLFSQEGIAVVGHGAYGGKAYGDFACCPEITKNISVPYLPSICYTDDFPAEEIGRIIQKQGIRRVGIVAMNHFPAGIYAYLREALPKLEIADASGMMDRIQAVKSPYELSLCKKTVRLHDDLMAAVPTILRAGMTERELCLRIRHLADEMFCGECVVLAGAHPRFPDGNLYLYSNHTIRRGDCVYLLIELAGPGGMWAELGRTFSMGEPSREMQRAWADAVRLENDLAARCKPGVSAREMFGACNRRLEAGGYQPERKFFAHGQGYDIVARPIFDEGERMTFEENMYLSIHPRCQNGEAAAICMDNFVVTREGAKRLSVTPQELVTIEY